MVHLKGDLPVRILHSLNITKVKRHRDPRLLALSRYNRVKNVRREEGRHSGHGFDNLAPPAWQVAASDVVTRSEN
jgi:hypothetical protein